MTEETIVNELAVSEEAKPADAVSENVENGKSKNVEKVENDKPKDAEKVENDKVKDDDKVENGNVKDAENVTKDEAVFDTKLDNKIVRQIEYYFGDANLPRDNFLKEEIKKNEGWVSLDTLLCFNRLKQITTDKAVIVKALATLGNGLVEVNEEKSSVRRNLDLPVPELSKEMMELLKLRSIYVKNLPLDLTLDDLITFFEEFGKVDQVLMRRDQKKMFKGSVFVIFSDKEKAEAFIKSEDVKHKDVVLEKKYRFEYLELKAKERKESKDVELKKRDAIKEVVEKDEEQRKSEELKDKIIPGSILETKGYSEGTTREIIKEVFSAHASIAWVNFNKGDVNGSIRFNGENSAAEALTKAKGENENDEVKVNDTMVKCRVLSGDEEFNHWKNSFAQARESIKGRRGGRGGRGRGGRGGRGGGSYRGEREAYKGKRERWASKRMGGPGGDSAPSEKVAKTDA